MPEAFPAQDVEAMHPATYANLAYRMEQDTLTEEERQTIIRFLRAYGLSVYRAYMDAR